MGATHVSSDAQPFRPTRLRIACGEDGNVRLIFYPPAGFRMVVNGEHVQSIDFPMPPELATNVARNIVDAALWATPEGEAGAH